MDSRMLGLISKGVAARNTMPVTLWSSRSNAASIGGHPGSQPSAPLEETGIELLEADLEKR